MINEYSLLNKGLPSLKAIDLSIDLISLECTNNSKKFNQLLIDKMKLINDDLSTKYGFPFFVACSKFTFAIDDNLISSLIFDPNMIIRKLSSLINMPDEIVCLQDLTPENKQIINNRLKEISRIRSEKQLEQSYPELYKNYIYLKDLESNITKIRNYNRLVIEDEARAKNYQSLLEMKNTLKNYGFESRNVNIVSYINNITNILKKNFKVSELRTLMQYVAENNINLSDYDSLLNEEKLALLIAAAHLSYAYSMEEFRQENISYVTEYLLNKDKLNKDISLPLLVNFDGEGRKDTLVTNELLLKSYRKFLLTHKDIYIIHKNREDFIGCDLSDIEEYIKNYSNQLEASWNFLENKDGVYKGFVEKINSSNLDQSIKQERLELASLKLKEKEEYYNVKNKPYYIVQGKNKFNGYIGFIYSNGKVVLDRYFSDKKCNIPTNSDAAYIMNVDDFIKLSMISKESIIENKLCGRVIHRGDWMSRMDEYLKEETTIDTLENVELFRSLLLQR